MNKFFIQGIVIYAIFILGISIVSEWMSNKLKPRNPEIMYRKLYDKKIDEYLEQCKKELKQEYYFKMKQYMSNERDREYFTEYRYDNYSGNMNMIPEEDIIMKEVDKKLRDGVTMSLDEHAMGRNTVGQIYSKVDGWVPEEYPLTYANMFKKYKKIDREINWQEPAKVVIPPKDYYNIDHKYEFIPGKGNKEPYKIPGKSGEAPSKYFFRGQDYVQHRNTFFDDKYDPKKYKVQPLDGYTSSYTVFE